MDLSNPWRVPNVEAFLYYCCPECDERNQSRELFIKHAIDCHPSSKDCFYNVKLEVDEVVEYENDVDLDEEGMEFVKDEIKTKEFAFDEPSAEYDMDSAMEIQFEVDWHDDDYNNEDM